MNSTELDYYAVLNISREAEKDEITLAYRKLAIKLNPNRDPRHERDFVPNEAELTHMDPLSKERQWDYINMAYDVLGNDLNRSIYDRFGEAGLFMGVYLPNGYFPPYQYHGDNLKIYHEVFGSYSPYANVIDIVTNPPILYSTKEDGIGVRTRDPPVEKIMPLALEEVRFGCTKLMHVMREEFVDVRHTRTEKRKKTLKIIIAPGTTVGTRYCFTEEGDRHPTRIPADIIFIVADKSHPIFKRRNNHDLVFVKHINLCEALTGLKFNIETLDKRKLTVRITEVVHPGYSKHIPNEGLPKCPVQGIVPQPVKEFGDIIIEFTVKFPNYLNNRMKEKCRDFFRMLKESEAEEEANRGKNPMQILLQKKLY